MRNVLMLAIAVSFGACSAGEGPHVTIRTVSNYSGRPMAGIQVQVGQQAWRTTDADGKAAFDGVQEPFEVRVHQTTTEYEYVLPMSYRVVGHGSSVQVRTGLT